MRTHHGKNRRRLVAGVDGRVRHRVDLPRAAATQVALTPDGARVVVALDASDGNPEVMTPGTGAVRFLDVDTGAPTGPKIEFTDAV